MNYLSKEKVKNIFICALIFLGLVQVGILWGYQSQGTPINFLSRFFNKSDANVSDTDTREGLFKPDRLVLSDGEKAHWILKEENQYYDLFWTESKHALKEIVQGNVAIRESDVSWIDAFEKRCYMVDFGYDMNSELLNWFLGVSGKSQDIDTIREFIIKPDIINEKKIIVYIHMADNKVYVSDEINTVRDKSLNSIVTAVKESEKYREYWTLKSGRIDETLRAKSDILYILDSPKYWPYYSVYAAFSTKGKWQEEFAEIILGKERERYNTSVDSSGTLQFTNTNNIYKYYSNGYLYYQYLKDNDSAVSRDIGEALLNAYNFIAKIKILSDSDADILLTYAEELQGKQGIYEFHFDYKLAGVPVTIDIENSSPDSAEMKHAISIKANSKRVLQCDCLVRDIKIKEKNRYCDRVFDVLNYAGESHEVIQNLKNMYIGYYIDTDDELLLEPKLIVDMKDEFRVFVMPSEKGD